MSVVEKVRHKHKIRKYKGCQSANIDWQLTSIAGDKMHARSAPGLWLPMAPDYMPQHSLENTATSQSQSHQRTAPYSVPHNHLGTMACIVLALPMKSGGLEECVKSAAAAQRGETR